MVGVHASTNAALTFQSSIGSFLIDEDPPPHETRTNTTPVNVHLKVRICCFSIVGNDITPPAE